MAVEALLAQTIHEAPSCPNRETSPLAVCCICGLLRDETGPSLEDECWVTQGTYRKTHGVDPANRLLTHTYCPECFTQVMDGIER
jgi:hypothetical protein